MLQDIAPYVYHNEYTPCAPQPEDYLLIYREQELLLRQKEASFSLPKIKELAWSAEQLHISCRYLFSISQKHFFLASDTTASSLSGYSFQPIRVLRNAHPAHLAFAGITGMQLSHWYDTHRFCGRCASPMKHSDKERMVYCPKCKTIEYPKICPAVIVGILNGDKILLSTYAGRDVKSYALIAGFSEIGETIEGTVHREVMEEVGLKVKNLRFYKSQPWSFSDSLLMGFFCEVDGSDEIRIDHSELATAQWFTRDEIILGQDDISLTREMILKYKNKELPF